jgi:type IV pilus assembly protein PilE
MDHGRRCGQATRGFTLIEMMMVLCVLAIIALIALPSYGAAANKARRTEGRILLQTVLIAEERYYISFNRYTSDAGSGGLNIAAESQPGGYYALARLLLSGDGQSVTALVEPRNAQAGDTCGNLTLDSVGRRGSSGAAVADCW